MANTKTYNIGQGYLINFHPKEFFKPDSIEWIINDIVEKHIDEEPYLKNLKNENIGQKAYSPKILLKIIFFCYARGCYSSRAMENNMKTNLSCIFLADHNIIDHSTICRFLIKHQKEIEKSFSKVLYICYKAKLVNLDMMAVDGTKLKANASKNFTGNKKEFEKLKRKFQENIKKLIEKQRRIDKTENNTERSKAKTKRIARQKKKCENYIKKIDDFFDEIKNEPEKDKVKTNLTDRDCRRQKNMNGYIEGYNAQAVVNDTVIIANDVVTVQSDRNELFPMIHKAEILLTEIGIKKSKIKKCKILADAGYRNANQIGKLSEEGYHLYLPNIKSGNPESVKKITIRECKLLVKDGQCIIECPGRKKHICKLLHDKTTNRHSYRTKASREKCENCNYFEKCFTGIKGRYKRFDLKKEVFDNNEYLKKIDRRMASDKGKHIYNQRIGLIERVFGSIKENRKFRSFHHRGLNKVKTIWSILCTVHNIKALQSRGITIPD